jgi:hypothetical protein
VGCISNLGPQDQAWLARMLQIVPEVTHVSVHRYADKTGDPTLPKPGYDSRVAEMDALMRIIGPRVWCVSEHGFHTAPFTTGVWIWTETKRLTPIDVRWRRQYDWAVFESYGRHAAFTYQLNSGDTDDPLGRYGIRLSDGTWIPELEHV